MLSLYEFYGLFHSSLQRRRMTRSSLDIILDQGIQSRGDRYLTGRPLLMRGEASTRLFGYCLGYTMGVLGVYSSMILKKCLFCPLCEKLDLNIAIPIAKCLFLPLEINIVHLIYYNQGFCNMNIIKINDLSFNISQVPKASINKQIYQQNKQQTIQMEQPPHRSTLLTRPQQEDRRHLQWGVTPPENTSYLQRPFSKGSDHLFTNDKKTYLAEEIRPYYGEQSQVNTSEGGFKKLKSNQIEMLKELKKQYDVLRNSSLDSRVFVNKKLTSESESNVDENSASNSEYQSSVKSKARRSQSRHKQDGKDLKMVILQKKQLEIMLNNSMKKIQELLHNQIQLKRTVLELKGKLESGKGSQSQFQTTLRKYRESEEALNRQLEESRRENEVLRAKIKQLTVSAGNLEGAANIKQLQLRKKDDKIRLCEEQIQLERNRYKSLQLDLKKVKMEYELLEKSRNEEIGQLNKIQGSIEESWKIQNNNKIKKLEQELAIKEERYALLLAKMSSNQAEQKKQEEREYTQNLQKLISTLQQEKNQQNSEAIAVVLSKLNQMHTPDERLLQELSLLKKQLQAVKTSQSTQKDSYSFSLEQKIRQLQKVIDEQNTEKGYFMQDLKKLTRDFNQIKKDREEVMRQNKELKYILDRLESENKKYRSDLDQIKNVPVDLTESQIQNKQLVAKLQLFNYKEIQLAAARQEINKLNEQTKAKTQAYEEEVRLLKRQLNDQEFKVFKSRQQYELKLSLLKIEHQAQITRLQQELDRAHKNFALQKSNIENRKIQLQSKLLDKDKEIEERSSAVINDSKQKENSLQKAQADFNQRVKELQERHALQIANLIAKLQVVAESNEKYVEQGLKYAQAEQQIAQLKKAVRMGRNMTEGLDHLWQIKETEYSNINDIIKSLAL